jgi:hypothetical protein
MAQKQESNPSSGKRQSWLDESKQSSLIDEYAQKLSTFMDALADGRIDDRELADQEKRLVTLMKDVEPSLDDAQHEKVTRLLCELTAYNVMQALHSLQESRPKTVFRG